MSNHIYLSDVVSDRTSVLFWFLIRDLISIGGRACSGFSARPLAPPPPTMRPPGTPTSHHAEPSRLIGRACSFGFLFPRSNFFSLSSTSFALGVIRWTVATDRRIPR
jgi:hypothetical protein